MTQPDTLHARLEAEIRRRLEVARAATPGPWRLGDWNATFGTMESEVTAIEHAPDYGSFPQIRSRELDTDLVLEVENGYDEDIFAANAAHVILHDPADAIRRYEGELETLERHVQTTTGCCLNCCDSSMHRDSGLSTAPYPCGDLKSLAHRLGVSVE